MITRVWSSLGSFKSVDLNSGMNVLLADRTGTSTERDTRNRAGKSSLVEIIDFVLGANADSKSALQIDVLRDHKFGIELELRGKRIVVSRTPAEHSRIVVEAGDASHLPIKPSMAATGEEYWTIDDWRLLLGHLWFDLPTEVVKEEADKPPSYRQLMGYFIRRAGKGGFESPTKTFFNQGALDQRLAVSFLLGLDWRLVRRWKDVERREQGLKKIRDMVRKGELRGIVQDAAELRSKLALAEDHLAKAATELEQFRVLPEYRRVEDDANLLGQEIGRLSNEDALDRALVHDYEAALAAEIEQTPGEERVLAVYEEAGIALPTSVSRRWDEVVEFHGSVIRNRRLYLEGEIEAAKSRMRERAQRLSGLDGQRADLLGLLASHGALEQYTAMQSSLSSHRAKVESLSLQLEQAEQLERDRVELKVERSQLQLELKQDLKERRDRASELTVLFSEISERLYPEGGSLEIRDSDAGPKFEARLHGERSTGVGHMKIFCFDMMVTAMRTGHGMGPGLLVHDSHLFDGVDARQRRSALQAARSLSDEVGFQYLVTMNSDDWPGDEAGLQSTILPVKLTDREDGGLFGVRFD